MPTIIMLVIVYNPSKSFASTSQRERISIETFGKMTLESFKEKSE